MLIIIYFITGLFVMVMVSSSFRSSCCFNTCSPVVIGSNAKMAAMPTATLEKVRTCDGQHNLASESDPSTSLLELLFALPGQTILISEVTILNDYFDSSTIFSIPSL